ncbi:MAG TPA: aquaporin [Actinomycetota bacterium]|jgi:aquaporin Z
MELDKIGQKLTAEFVGTFALVFIGAGAVIMGPSENSTTVGVALASGLVYAVMVSVLAHISGAHFNPAVTIGVWVTGNIKTGLAGAYIGTQLVAAAIAALLLRGLYPEPAWKAANLGAPGLGQGVSSGQGVLLEAVLTFFLVFAVYGTAVDDRGPFAKTAGLTIGLVLTFGIFAGGPLTGAAMNPARAFGPMLVGGHWSDWWVYWIGPIGGGVIAAAVYWFAFLDGREKLASARKSEHPIGGPTESDWSDEPA